MKKFFLLFLFVIVPVMVSAQWSNDPTDNLCLSVENDTVLSSYVVPDHAGNYYVFYYMLRGWVIDGSTNNSITSYLNHSKNPNLSTFFTFHFVDGEPELHLSFKTNQDVEIGEELFIDYGEEFWKDNPIQEL